MGFDIRMPIGMLFSLFGILLVGYGAMTTNSAMYAEHSLGMNINLWWGGVLLAFGLVMLWLTKFRPVKATPADLDADQKKTGH